MTAVTLTPTGQIDLPEEIRKLWKLRTGDQVAVRLRNDGVVELQPEKDDLMSLCGSIKPKVRGVTIEAMNEAIRDAAAGK